MQPEEQHCELILTLTDDLTGLVLRYLPDSGVAICSCGFSKCCTEPQAKEHFSYHTVIYEA